MGWSSVFPRLSGKIRHGSVGRLRAAVSGHPRHAPWPGHLRCSALHRWPSSCRKPQITATFTRFWIAVYTATALVSGTALGITPRQNILVLAHRTIPMDRFLDASSTLVKPSHLEADNIREMPCGSWRDGYSKDRRQGNRPEGCRALPGSRVPSGVDGRRADACGPLKGGLYHYRGKEDPAIDVLKRIRRVFPERILAIGRAIPGPHRARIRPVHTLDAKATTPGTLRKRDPTPLRRVPHRPRPALSRRRP